MIGRGRCPKCDHKMEEGWIPAGGALSLAILSIKVASHTTWLPGQPETKPNGEVKWKKGMEKHAIPLHAYKCMHCGFIELYANE